MKIHKIRVFGWEGAIEGMRYPKNSEAQSDSMYKILESSDPDANIFGPFCVGPKDLDLMLRLTKAGKDHRKVLRMIHVQASVDMPFAFWKQFDTYRVGVTEISRSTMHKGIGNKYITKENFTISEWNEEQEYLLNIMNKLQNDYINTTDSELKAKFWRRIIDIIPLNFNQERMIDLNYEVLIAILGSRYKVEKLNMEWDFFCEAFLEKCPYLNELFEVTKKQRSLTTKEFENLSK